MAALFGWRQVVVCCIIASALQSAIQVTGSQEDVITVAGSAQPGGALAALSMPVGAMPGAPRTQRSSGLPDYCTKRSHTSGLALHVCGGVCRRRWQHGLPVTVGPTPGRADDLARWLAAGAPPPPLRILLVPRLFAANFIAAYIHDMVCDLEARGWIALDLDTVVQTPDIQASLTQGQPGQGLI